MRPRPQCFLPWCCQRKRENPQVHLYKFPISRKRQLEWLEHIKLDELEKMSRAALAQIFICSDHFKNEFKTIEWPKRNPAVTLNGVPTIKIAAPPELTYENRINLTHSELIFLKPCVNGGSIEVNTKDQNLFSDEDATNSIDPEQAENPLVEMIPVIASRLISYDTYTGIVAEMEHGIKELQKSIADKFQLTPETIDSIWKSRAKIKNESFDQIVLIQTEESPGTDTAITAAPPNQ